MMKCLSLLVGLVILTGVAEADVTFELICQGPGYQMSADGTVVVGNTNADLDFDTFRWTAEGGRELLGMNPYPVLGRSAGHPAVSADGTRVSATILGSDSTYGTQGVWTLGEGWQETMPPAPPDGGIMDNFYGSAWGLSGDGTTLVGLYWRPGQAETGSAHASAWTESTGTFDLGSTGKSSRANNANYDGSVVVGWDQDPTGTWRPAVWVDGELSLLCSGSKSGQGEAVTPGGSIIVGYERHDSTEIKTAAMWRWNGSGYGPTEYLGTLPGSAPNSATVKANDVSADGSVVVGYNSYYGDPFYTTGFIWTEATGIMDVVDFLADNGIVLPHLDIVSLEAISDDGLTILGIADEVEAPFVRYSFLIHLDDPIAGAPQAPGDLARIRIYASPNPISADGATLSFTIPASTIGSLAVYDVTGRLVRCLLHGSLVAGRHDVRWDGRDALEREVCPGVYFSRFEAGDMYGAVKLVIIR